jgi:hypothetical protein
MSKSTFSQKKGKFPQNGSDENILKIKNPRTCRHKMTHPKNSTVGVGSINWAILSCLFLHFSVLRMARKMGKGRKTIQRHLKTLNSMGLCLYSNSSWKLTIKGHNLIKQLEKETPLALPPKVRHFGTNSLNFFTDRCHNVKFKVPLVAKPYNDDWLKNWQKYAIRNNTFYILKENVSSGQVCTTYTGKSLIIQMPISRSENPRSKMTHLRTLALILCKKYELRYEISLNSSALELIGQHHAFQNEPFSKACKGEGISKSINDVCVDSSENDIPEFEFTSKANADKEATKYIVHVGDVVRNCELLPSQVESKIKSIEEHLIKVSMRSKNI